MHFLEMPNIVFFLGGGDLFQPEFSPSKTIEKYNFGIIPKKSLMHFSSILDHKIETEAWRNSLSEAIISPHIKNFHRLIP